VSLRGKRALVTGAGQRLGAVIATALGAAGMQVGLHYHRSRAGAEAVGQGIEEAGGRAVLLEADLSAREAAQTLVAAAVQGLGGLDLLVLSAANFDTVPLSAVTDAHWERALGLNLLAPFRIAQAAATELLSSAGNIIFITCSSTRTPFRNHLPYVVSKGAVSQLMRTLALELAPQIRVNAVAPGSVLPPSDMDADKLERLAKSVPLGRLGTPEAVADAVLYLAQAEYVTGEELFVDGGRGLFRAPTF
jgi:pteridine reductase